MSQELKFIACDLGAESGRTVLGLLKDDRLRLVDISRFPNGGVKVGESLYWDVLRLFDEMKNGIRLATHQHGADISGVGIDTWGVDFALLGPNDVLLENPHCYRDPRIDGMMEEVFTIVPKSRIYEETGIQFMPLNTLYQIYAVKKMNPWLLETAKSLLMMPDLFNFWFTGTKVCEFTEATTTQFYNPRSGTWARGLLDLLEIPSHFLMEIVPPGTVLGRIRTSIASDVGAKDMTLIAPATHDTGSAVAAVPAKGKGHAYISSGTWSLMGVESSEPIINEKALSLNFTNEGGVCGTYRFLRNIMGLWLVQECRRTWAQKGTEYSYSELAELAANAEPFKSVIDPDDVSFLHPGDMPARIREFCKKTNQPVPDHVGEVIRCALDSLALKYRWVLEGLESLMGQRIEPIHIVGGGTQNKLLCQLAANVTNRSVIAGPVEATAIGNILIQALALGHIHSLDEGREIVRRSFDVVTYEPRHDERVEAAYQRFKTLLPQ